MDSDDNDANTDRRSSLAISALLNDDSIDPVASPSTRRLTPEEKRENRKTWHGFTTEETPKAKRKRISTQQLNRLMEIFQQTDTPSSEVREHLAEELGMTKREVQVWFQNRRAKASRARAIASTTSNPNQTGPTPLSTVPTRYDPFVRTDHHGRYSVNMPPPPPLPAPMAKNHHYPPSQHQPIITFTPPQSRRSSNAFSDTSSIPSTQSSATTLQPIAPMPPPFTAPYNHPVSLTPPSGQPIVSKINSQPSPLHHGGFEDVPMRRRNNAHRPTTKRPKSVIGVLNSTM